MAAEVEKVAEGKRRKKRSGGGRYTTSRPRGGRPNPCKLFVSNISFFVTEEQVGDVFAEFGPVKSFQILRDRKTRRSKGCGFVVFEDVASVERALSATEDQLTLDERTMKVERPLSKKELLAAREGVASGDTGEAGEGVEMEEPLMAVPEPPLLPPQHFVGPELNDDVLLLVMQYLSVKDRIRVERVSKRWCRVAKASWQYVCHVSFEGCFHPFQNKKCGGLTDDILHSVLERGGRNITSLDLSCNPKLITDFGISIIGMYCSNLERLDLSEMYLTQTAMKKLSQKCPELKWLRVCGAHTVGENCLWWGLHNWKKLEFLDISLNVRVNGKCFFMAGDTLLHVHLQHCKKLLDSSLELLAARVPHLETLDISHCPRLTGVSLRSISQHCRKLKELKFAGKNTGVTISDTLTVAQLSQLEVLVVNEQPMFGDETLRLVGRECPNLRTLSCVACHMVTDAGLSCLSTCQRLSDINFSYCPVTDQGLAAVLNSETRRVCIRACHGITDDCIALMGRVCPRLETLDVCGCQLSLSDQCLLPLQDSLQSFSSRHHNVTLMAGGSSIGEEALEEFARVTGASVSLTDLSVPSLSADYVPDDLDYFQFSSEDEEDWDHEATPHPAPERVPQLEAPSIPVLYPHGAQDDHGDDHGDLDDFLIADDPAMFSDEFSGPEDWGFG